MRILVTGSSGMLGVALCQALSGSGEHEIFGLDIRPPSGKFGKSLDNFIEADITQGADLIKKTAEINPELVIHTAAWTDVDGCQVNPDKAEVINARGTRNVARACKETGAVLFYISTDYVFDGKKQRPYTENDTPNPINVYGQSKLAGEKYIQEILDKYIIIRSSWLFGQNGKNFVDTIINKAREDKSRELKVVSDQTGSPTSTKDLAGGIAGLISIIFAELSDSVPASSDSDKISCSSGKPASPRRDVSAEPECIRLMKIYHITNSGSCSWHEFASRIIEYAGLSDTAVKPILADELEPARSAPRPKMSVLDNSRYNKLTGRPLRPWPEALSIYIKTKQ